MRLSFLHFVILALCALCGGMDAEDDYGTGITLSRDYATVSVYFANNTFIDVAKIQGGHTYQAYMKDHFDHKEISNSLSTPWYCPFPDRFCKHWPGRNGQTHNPLLPMLKALLAAVETTIERDVTSVLVSTHVTQEQDHWATISAYMLSALKELKVNRWDRALAKVAPTLLLELHFVSDCENEEVRYYLAVEYTKDSLVGQIWDGVCGVYDMIQTVSSSSSGYDAISACRKESENAEQCNAPLRRVLHELFKTSGHPKHQLDLSALLVSGEKGDDKNFLMALIQSLEDSHVNFTSADTSKLREYAPDLAFAGSRAMAEMEISRKRYKPDHRDEL